MPSALESKESKPHPWLTFLTSILLAVCASAATTTFAAGERHAELRHVQQQVLEVRQEVSSLTGRANGTDVALATIRTELAHIREGVDELRALLRGNNPRR